MASPVAEELRCLQALVACLDGEARALCAEDPQALEPILAEKQLAVRDLDRLEKSRPRQAEADPLWPQVLEQARQCRDRNRINGELINALSRRVSQSLDTLGVRPDVYSARGRVANTLPTRALARG